MPVTLDIHVLSNYDPLLVNYFHRRNVIPQIASANIAFNDNGYYK